MEKNEAHKIGEIMAKSIMGKDFVAEEKPAVEYAYKIVGSGSEYFSYPFDSLDDLFLNAEDDIGKEKLINGAAIQVGEVKRIGVPVIDVDRILEDAQQEIADQCELGEYYLDDVTKEHKDILSKELNVVLRNWAKKYGYEPSFYDVANIVDYIYCDGKWELLTLR